MLVGNVLPKSMSEARNRTESAYVSDTHHHDLEKIHTFISDDFSDGEDEEPVVRSQQQLIIRTVLITLFMVLLLFAAATHVGGLTVWFGGDRPTESRLPVATSITYDIRTNPVATGNTPPAHFHAQATGAVKPNALSPQLLFPALWRCPSLSAASFVAATSDTHQSQSHEDIAVWDLLFHQSVHSGPANPGIFLEMGALDGKMYSNSWYYEMVLGWRGVLLEAHPRNVEKLMLTPRPGSVKLGMGACGTPDATSLDWIRMVGDGDVTAVAGVLDTMPEGLKQRYHANPSRESQFDVPCAPLSQVLSAVGVQWLDYWSLDVEGAELHVIRSFDFDAIPVHLMHFELSHTARDQQIEDILLGKGMTKLQIARVCAPTPNANCGGSAFFRNNTFKERSIEEVCIKRRGQSTL